MKRLILLLILALPSTLLAQDMSEEMQQALEMQQSMQQNMQQFVQMAGCMKEIDQTRLQEYQQQSIALATKLEALCSSGKRDEAERTILEYQKKLANDPVLKAINTCMEKVEGDAFMDESEDEDMADDGNTHICDEM